MAIQTQTITATGTTNWTCPIGVTSVQVELWGAGGSGGPATGTASGAGGGAGGQYAIKNVAVTPGTVYAVVVPAATTANTTNVVNGADATFNSTTVVAKGGAGGAKATGTTGSGGAGSTAGGVGDTVYAGGSGGNGVSSTSSGGGGSGAGSTGSGNSGSGATAGTAKLNNGGAGGAGVTTANTRNNGSNYGGGGSGGLSSSSTDRAGGNGAQGLAVLTWTAPLIGSLTDNFDDNSFDTTKWTGAYGTVTETGGAIHIACTSGYSGYTSNGYYDLTGSQMFTQIVSGPALGNGTTEMYFQLSHDSTNKLSIIVSGSLIYFRVMTAGVNDDTTTTFNLTTHKWWRIRESSGSVFFDTSTDGITWTNRKTATTPSFVTNVAVDNSSGYYGTETSPADFVMDNFNIAPATGNPAGFFAMF